MDSIEATTKSQQRPQFRSAQTDRNKGIVLTSASWQPGGDVERKHNTEQALDNAGWEVEKEPEPKPEPHLTPAQLREKNLRSYGAQSDAARDKYADWNEVVDQNIEIGVPAQEALITHKNAAEMVYYIGRHPQYARDLGAMSPEAARAEISRLSAQISPTHRSVVRPREGATFREISEMPDFPGKARALKRAAAHR